MVNRKGRFICRNHQRMKRPFNDLEPINGLFIFFAAATEALIDQSSKAGTYERSHDEEPHLTHGTPFTALRE